MKQILFTLIISMCCFLHSLADDVHISFEMKGSEPSSKNYCFNIHYDKDMNINELQYSLWKVLKDHGYTLVDSISADLVIDVNYFQREENRTSSNYVKIGEKNTQVMGANVPIPIWSTETHKYNTNVSVLQIKALPKNASNLAMPYWQILMPTSLDGLLPLEPYWIYSYDLLWFTPGLQNIVYSFDSKGIKKIKVNGKLLKRNVIRDIEQRIIYLQNMPEMDEYNRLLSR